MRIDTSDAGVNRKKSAVPNSKGFKKRIKILPRYCEDSLEKLADDDLRSTFYVIRSVVERGKRENKNVRSREVDLCYIQRECQLRDIKLN